MPDTWLRRRLLFLFCPYLLYHDHSHHLHRGREHSHPKGDTGSAVKGTINSYNMKIASGVSDQTRQIRELTNLQLEKIKEVYKASKVISANTNDMREAIRQVKV